MDWKSSHQTSIPSKQKSIRSFSTPSLKPPLVFRLGKNKLNPWFVTGFIVAEGTFALQSIKIKHTKQVGL